MPCLQVCTHQPKAGYRCLGCQVMNYWYCHCPGNRSSFFCKFEGSGPLSGQTIRKHTCPSGQASGNESECTGVSLLYFPCCKVRQTVKEDFTCQLTGHLGNRERGVRAKRVYQMAEVVEGQLTSGPEGPKDRTAPGTTYLGVGKLKGQVALVQKQGMHCCVCH